MPLTPVFRHGFTFWVASYSTRPPLEDLLPPPKEKRPPAPPRRRGKPSIMPGGPPQPPQDTPRPLVEIQLAIMRAFQVEPTRFFGQDRTANVAEARIASIGLARTLTEYSLRIIGAAHYRDACTAEHALKRCEDLRETDPQFRARIDQAEQSLASGDCPHPRVPDGDRARPRVPHSAPPPNDLSLPSDNPKSQI